MLDEDSLIVTYNDWRGEPRACRPQEGRGAGPASVGDCVDCNACVAVCPMGIDIRDGQQLECITCALCIDACDDVMDKIGKPRGPDLLHHRQPLCRTTRRARTPHWDWRHLLRPRTFIYFGPVGGGRHRHAGRRCCHRDRLDVNVVPDRNPLYRDSSPTASIRNGYTVKILNMKQEPRSFRLTLEGPARRHHGNGRRERARG